MESEEQIRLAAESVVAGLLNEAPEGLKYRNTGIPYMTVDIQTADGQVQQVEFNGWWDFRAIGRGIVASIGVNGSHGALPKGAKILTPVPNPQEWAKLIRSPQELAPASS